MAYVAVAKAQFDYEAQDAETELSFKEDQIFYVIEKEDEEWWKAKLKDEGSDGQIGLIPANYVEEIPPINQTRALFAYESTSPEELSMSDDALLHVYSAEEDWLLVRIGDGEHLGFVPRNYCEPLDASEEVEVADAADAAAEVEAARQAEKDREIAEKQRQLKLKDKVETWSISELEGKKKKKGTLGVGNAAVFFASDTDKSAPVKQYPITELSTVAQPSSKNLTLSFTTLGRPLEFHCGDSSTAKAILAKLESSKAAAGEALELIEEARSGAVSSGDEHEEPAPAPTAAAAPRGVRFAPPAAAAASAETATVQYDFDADGDDELTVKDGETVTVLDKENDEWWLVKNSRGKEGVVPAAYVQLNDGSASAAGGAASQQVESDDEEEREAEAAARRARQAQAAEEEARRIQAAAAERRRQEEEDRQLAQQIEEEQKIKAQRRALRRQEEERRQREEDAQAARENARAGGIKPPRITKRPSNNDVAAAANRLPIKGHNAPVRPPENNRPKPNPGKIRMWSDKSGQFNVEAEYLGLNGNKIRLHKLNGVIIEVPLDKLSSRDAELVRRHEQRKSRPPPVDEDDVPLGQSTPRRAAAAPARSVETQRRAEEPIPPEAMRQPPPRKPRFDWFEFFLSAGCDMDDCTRYAANFDRDRIDDTILPDLESSTLRTLGLKEGDVIRVKKAINNKFAKKTPEQQAQIDLDAEYAKQLQEHENSGSKGPVPQPPPGLFTGPGGKLANNTRRGRPDKKASSGPDTVDPSAIAAASDQLSKVSVSTPTPPTPPPAAVSPPPAVEQKAASLGFDDDAWTIKPSSKPSSPAPPAPPPPAAPVAPVAVAAAPANTTESLLAQINALRPASTGISSNDTGGSGNFDKFSQMVGQSRAPSAPAQPSSQAYGLGVNSNQPMGQLIGQPTCLPSQATNGPRGPLAPVPTNQGLLNPMQPQQTGMFVPTRALSPLGPQQTGFVQQSPFMPQPTGFAQQPQQQQQMMAQPTGYQQGFQQGYGQQQQPYQMQPNFTGYPGQQQQQQSAFNAIASIPPPQPQQAPDKFAPSNIFAAMKKADFAHPEEQRPQESGKYDALRPLTTGYNGAPGMMPQVTGYQNGGNGMGMMPQQTGYGMGMGMGVQPQMTGYNPQMGMYQQNQNPYGYR